MGDKYAKAYSKGIKLVNAKKLNLQSNRLHSSGAATIISSLNSGIEDLNLA